MTQALDDVPVLPHPAWVHHHGFGPRGAVAAATKKLPPVPEACRSITGEGVLTWLGATMPNPSGQHVLWAQPPEGSSSRSGHLRASLECFRL